METESEVHKILKTWALNVLEHQESADPLWIFKEHPLSGSALSKVEAAVRRCVQSEVSEAVQEAVDAASWSCNCLCPTHGRLGCRDCLETSRCMLHSEQEVDRRGKLDPHVQAKDLWALGKEFSPFFSESAPPKQFILAVGNMLEWARERPRP